MGTDERDGGLLAADMFLRYWAKDKPGVDPHILSWTCRRFPSPSAR